MLEQVSDVQVVVPKFLRPTHIECTSSGASLVACEEAGVPCA